MGAPEQELERSKASFKEQMVAALALRTPPAPGSPEEDAMTEYVSEKLKQNVADKIQVAIRASREKLDPQTLFRFRARERWFLLGLVQ